MSAPSDDDVRDVLRALRSTPRHFKRATSSLSTSSLGRRPEADAWSVNEVLAHVRGAADVQGAWIAKMLAEDTPTIRYASPRTGMRKHAERSFEESLEVFSRERNALVRTLSRLTLEDWTRSATFTGTTPGWTQTVYDVAKGIATHERSHFEQVTEAAGGAT